MGLSYAAIKYSYWKNNMFDLLVIGAGTIGVGIAQAASLVGRRVVLMDDTVEEVEGLTVTPYTVTNVAADGTVSIHHGGTAATLKFKMVVIAAGSRTSEIIELTEKANGDSLKMEQLSRRVMLILGNRKHAKKAVTEAMEHLS